MRKPASDVELSRRGLRLRQPAGTEAETMLKRGHDPFPKLASQVGRRASVAPRISCFFAMVAEMARERSSRKAPHLDQHQACTYTVDPKPVSLYGKPPALPRLKEQQLRCPNETTYCVCRPEAQTWKQDPSTRNSVSQMLIPVPEWESSGCSRGLRVSGTAFKALTESSIRGRPEL